jgi:hypothetical protein
MIGKLLPFNILGLMSYRSPLARRINSWTVCRFHPT